MQHVDEQIVGPLQIIDTYDHRSDGAASTERLDDEAKQRVSSPGQRHIVECRWMARNMQYSLD